MKLLDQIRSWFKRKAVASPSQPSPPIAIPHKLASPRIVLGYVRVTNDSNLRVVLTGGPLKQLAIAPNSFALVKSPILENVSRISGYTPQREGAMRPTMELAFINEWDALEVLDNMIVEYARGRAYDIMTPEELIVCTLPLPKRALAELIDRIGLKAQRENESNIAEAR